MHVVTEHNFFNQLDISFQKRWSIRKRRAIISLVEVIEWCCWFRVCFFCFSVVQQHELIEHKTPVPPSTLIHENYRPTTHSLHPSLQPPYYIDTLCAPLMMWTCCVSSLADSYVELILSSSTQQTALGLERLSINGYEAFPTLFRCAVAPLTPSYNSNTRSTACY